MGSAWCAAANAVEVSGDRNLLCFWQGKAKLPFPKEGYWGQASVTTRPTSISGTNASITTSLVTFEPSGVLEISEDPPYFLPCAIGSCKGKDAFECEAGYTGVQCSECTPGQFLWRSTCSTKCSDLENPTAVTVFGIAAVIAVWILMNVNKKCDTSPASVLVCLGFGLPVLVCPVLVCPVLVLVCLSGIVSDPLSVGK